MDALSQLCHQKRKWCMLCPESCLFVPDTPLCQHMSFCTWPGVLDIGEMIVLILTWPLKRNVLVIQKGSLSSCHTQTFCQQNGQVIVEAGQRNWERKRREIGLFLLSQQCWLVSNVCETRIQKQPKLLEVNMVNFSCWSWHLGGWSREHKWQRHLAGGLVGTVPRVWRYSLNTKMSHCGCDYSIKWSAKWRKTTWTRWNNVAEDYLKYGRELLSLLSVRLAYNFDFNSTLIFTMCTIAKLKTSWPCDIAL